MTGAPDLLEVGRVDRAHGLRGEVVVALTTDRTERLSPGARLWVAGRPRTVAGSRRHQHRWIVAFDDVGSREAAEALRGAPVEAEPLDAEEGELWVHELVGSTVALPDGTEVGRVASVQDNPAHELLVLDSGALVPVVFVTDASGLPGRVVVDPPPGLLDDDG